MLEGSRRGGREANYRENISLMKGEVEKVNNSTACPVNSLALITGDVKVRVQGMCTVGLGFLPSETGRVSDCSLCNNDYPIHPAELFQRYVHWDWRCAWTGCELKQALT
jgi:hypothetical protein